jgi:hypothetical protein
VRTHTAFRLAFAAALVTSLTPVTVVAGDRHRGVPELASTFTRLSQTSSALTYWVNEADGAHVVTTIDCIAADENLTPQARHMVVRFAAVLLPGQAQLVSVPAPVGAVSPTLRIYRHGDSIEVSRVTDRTTSF